MKISKMVIPIFIVFFSFGCNLPKPPEDNSEICDNTIDDDGDGLIDCDDPGCDGEIGSDSSTCNSIEKLCNDYIDNDNDTFIDCADPDCFGLGPCSVEFCTDVFDNDGDGLIDCADPDCRLNPPCSETELCDDTYDNDGDGWFDCDDSDCLGISPCLWPEICSNEIDDDGDGDIDCEDSDCKGLHICSEICNNGIDDNQNGLVDCEESSCDSTHGPDGVLCQHETELDCYDNGDNDGDSLIDCDDPDCVNFFNCNICDEDQVFWDSQTSCPGPYKCTVSNDSTPIIQCEHESEFGGDWFQDCSISTICPFGSVCIGEDGQKECFPLCDIETHNSCPTTDSTCMDSLVGTDLELCIQDGVCDAVTQNCSGSSDGCYIINDSTFCLSSGTAGSGDLCQVQNDCIPGNICTGTPGQCYELCKYLETDTCSPQTCINALGDPVYGVCL